MDTVHSCPAFIIEVRKAAFHRTDIALIYHNAAGAVDISFDFPLASDIKPAIVAQVVVVLRLRIDGHIVRYGNRFRIDRQSIFHSEE